MQAATGSPQLPKTEGERKQEVLGVGLGLLKEMNLDWSWVQSVYRDGRTIA